MERMVQRSLAIAAHADDFELFATCACELGETKVVVVTDPGSKRHDELCASQKLLGYELLCWNFPDGSIYKQDIRVSIAELFYEYEPSVVLTHDPWKLYQLHPDHRAVGIQVTDAITIARMRNWYVPKEIWYWNCDRPTLRRRINRSKKLAALRCYESQGFASKHWILREVEEFRAVYPQEVYG